MIRSSLNIQGFTTDGVWVKPPNAARVDVVIQSAGAGGTCTARGADGDRRLVSYDADTMPDTVPIVVGRGGRGGLCGHSNCQRCISNPNHNEGSDGYVVIITSIPAE